MRKGKNPAKFKGKDKVIQQAFHQVIIPVYLPELKGYYKDGLEILKLCIESVYLTVHEKTFISVVNNGSCQEVRAYLDRCLENKTIHEVIHTSAIGKINAIAKGLSGHNFALVTITDADVLFTNGWQSAVYEVYKVFPKAGMVCSTPQPQRLRQLTEPIYFDNLFNNALKFRPVKYVNALKLFVDSLGNNNHFQEVHFKKILTIEENNVLAVIGSGHFSATYRAELVEHLKYTAANDKLSAQSDKNLIDLPSVKFGHWRLSTIDNYTYHLGNQLEDWMFIEFKKIIKEEGQIEKPRLTKFKKYNIVVFKKFIIRRLVFNKYFWKKHLVKLGLNKSEAKFY